ncbi:MULTISPECIES: LolA family protein [Arenibacter]|jgi:outer membrane lipoprotein carrier protein|uniref:Lipoprotein chaperone n=1 Tax=Arenibacter algicola TaxID=616991 RepID=A0A221UYD3_9FLAO|nr:MULTISPECIES: outer membrane lipoprotein carrier protein LolA [Arenibacter]ASO06158.1 lipoprotein chaperone [Arenibacter algicola]MDX1759248.1 outer membrane lipoprotein carrier protein LolA [Arenibacter algicola]GBF19577.1 lipoprotein chaperone [Arenibacter sp. NBRC 103722]|tara:strand:+ start:25444 stop:26073 length:630 start_codon:yes stop_codon:yes gene_type:complete
MRNLLFLVVLIAHTSLLLAQESKMNNTEIAEFKAKINETSKATTTIQSNFTQYKHLDFLSNDITTQGKMAFKVPNMVKWEYTEPFKYSIIFKDDKLIINDSGTKSNMDLGNSALFKKINQLIVNSVKGNLFQDSDFTMSYFKSSKYYKVIFIPKDEKIKSYIASFILFFDKQQADVMEVKMVEPTNDYTRIVFSDRLINKPLDNEVFTN